MNTPLVLDFSRDGVRLLTGAGAAPDPVGEVRLDDPQFGTRFEAVRRRVRGGSDGPVPTTLLLPSAEILITAIDAVQGETGAARDDRIRRALQELSPAATGDMAHDCKVGPDGRIHVAAIRRETLREAERFALAHGLQPVRLTAHAPGDGFLGRPDFGPASLAATAPAASHPGGDPIPAGVEPAADPTPRRADSGTGTAARIGPALRMRPAPPLRPAPGGRSAIGGPIRPSREEVEAAPPGPAGDPDPARSVLAPALLGLSAAILAAAGVWGAYFMGSDLGGTDTVAEIAASEPALPASAPAIGPADTSGTADMAAATDAADRIVRADASAMVMGDDTPPVADRADAAPVTIPAPRDAVPQILLPVALLSPSGPQANSPGASQPAGPADRPRVTEGRPAIVPPPAPRDPSGSGPASGSGDGVAVTAGAPPRIPPPRPAPAETDTAAEAQTAQSLAEATAAALSDTRTGTGAARNTSGAPPLSRAPRPRPDREVRAPATDAATTTATEAVVAEVVASLAGPGSGSGDGLAPAGDTTAPYAIARSLRPDSRPGGLTDRSDPEAAAPVRVARAEPPGAPRAASGAGDQASLRLNQINLIGVYGSQSNRRALVRLANGRFVKVKVGDRIDGGRIGAIGSDDLQYIKRGRSVSLSMPRG